ncbi:MAG: translation initiation factor eIF-2B [Candidatus Bathyarchaeia archaeon]
MDVIEEAAGRIKRLEVQGASDVAVTAIRALEEKISGLERADYDNVIGEIERARRILFESRETEPFMRNAIRFIEWKIRDSEWEDADALRELIHGLTDRLMDEFREAKKRIIDVGTRRILSGYNVLTHCHSSSVSGALRKAYETGRDFKVFATETRPRYQGHITVNEMIDAGIPVTLMVDSAVRNFMKKMDLVVVGADAITSEGNVINKIGTSLIALAAHEARIPFYVLTELLKFDPETIHGDYEVIEERAPSEVWDDSPPELRILNPAFDVTRRDHIHGIICEEGVISPHSILDVINRRYPWILEIYY